MKKLVLIILVLLFLTGCKQGNEVDYLARGQQFLSKMEYNNALQVFEQGKSAYPDDANYYLAIAEITLKKGDSERALATLYNGYTKTSSPQIANSIAEILLTQGNFSDSLEWFEKVLAQNNTDREALKGKIKILALRNDSEGLEQLQEAQDNLNYDSELYIMSAIINLQDTSEAARLIMQSSSADDANVELAKELRMALTGYEKAMTVHNLSRIVYVLLNYNWFELAQIPTTTITSENEFYETGYIYQGLIHLYTNQLPQAQETFKKVLEINPQNPDAKIFLTQTYYLQSDFENADILANEIVQDTEADLSLQQYQSLQEILYKNSEYQAIETFYDNFSPKLEIPADQSLIIIEALLEQSKFNQADTVIAKINKDYALLSGSEQARYKALAAYAAFHLDRKQDALNLISEAMEVDNSAAIVHYYKGKMLLENSEIEEAGKSLERARELDLEGNITSKVQQLIGDY